jgi:hypothetical protein
MFLMPCAFALWGTFLQGVVKKFDVSCLGAIGLSCCLAVFYDKLGYCKVFCRYLFVFLRFKKSRWGFFTQRGGPRQGETRFVFSRGSNQIRRFVKKWMPGRLERWGFSQTPKKMEPDWQRHGNMPSGAVRGNYLAHNKVFLSRKKP